MLVDWFTTAAQIVTFLILVYVLKRFLYKPILRAMDEREKQMVNALKGAEEQKRNAESERGAFEKKSQELTAQKEQILKNAVQEAGEERKRMISVAREEVAAEEARWREAIEHERTAFLSQLAIRIQDETFAISRKVLSDLAGASLEERITTRFIERLKSLAPLEKNQLAASLGDSSQEAVVLSAFELPQNDREQIEAAVKQELGIATGIRFDTAQEIIGGIELNTDGHKVSWTIQSYLSSLEREVAEVIEASEVTRGNPI